MKKYLAYILIVIALIGVFLPQNFSNAQTDNSGNLRDAPLGSCDVIVNAEFGTETQPNKTKDECTGVWQAYNTTDNKAPEPDKEALQKALGKGCPFDVENCVLRFAYMVFISLPSLILTEIAGAFNVLLISALSPNMYKVDFLSTTWTIVRDISNIFFILILLYTGIKTILGMGSSETKSIVANVVIMAILINFSMFFTKVVIDSSNVIALIFYDKITINHETPYQPIVSGDEKDIAGGLMAKVNPTALITGEFLNNIEKKGLTGVWEDSSYQKFFLSMGAGGVVAGVAAASIAVFSAPVLLAGAVAGGSAYVLANLFDIGAIPSYVLFSIICTVGALMIAITYSIFIGAISFMGRMVELWFLIIFSPFAFMSFSIPSLAHMDYIGWDNWLKRLISASFMAPIYMFFLYFIFSIADTNLWPRLAAQSNGINAVIIMIITILPVLMLTMLLLKAAELAKKGSGQFGDMALSGFKLAAGLTLGAIGLGTAVAGKATAGKFSKYAANDRARGEDKNIRTSIRDSWTKADGVWEKTKVAFSTPGKAFNGTIAKMADGKLGKTLGKADNDAEKKAHFNHEADEKTKELNPHHEGGYEKLSKEGKEEVEAALEKDALSKFLYNRKFDGLKKDQVLAVEEYLRRGWKPKVDGHGKTVAFGDNARTMDRIENDVPDVDSHGAPLKYKTDYMADMNKTNATLGEIAQLLRKGSWDPRALHELTGKSSFNKAALGTVALVAAGVRMGIKKGGGVEYGTPQKDFYKGIGDVISSALKNVKINIDAGGGGGGGDHGKGGGDHGGGGGHH